MRMALETWDNVEAFLEAGGQTLWLLFVVTLAMWTVILERIWYFVFLHPREMKRIHQTWMSRKDRNSWYARQVRSAFISEISLRASASLKLLKSLVHVCPLIGLLGTVMGMLEVFDAMAIAGTGNVRAVASGVSSATISTMAGMIAALSGLFLSVQLNRRAQKETRRIEDLLTGN